MWNNRVFHARNGPKNWSIGKEEETGEQVTICIGGPGIDQCENVDYVAEMDEEVLVALLGEFHNSVSVNG